MENLISESVDNYIPCKICGQIFRFLTWNHLSKHNLTREEYQRLYPDAPLCSLGYEKERSLQTKKFFGLNPEAKTVLSEAQKRRFQNLEERKELSKRLKEVFQRPKVKERHKLGIKRSWTAEKRAKYSVMTEELWKNEDYRLKHSEAQKRRWERDRELLSEKFREMARSPDRLRRAMEGRNKLVETLRALAEKYNNEGCKAVPLHHGFPVPDLIVVKNNRIIAVEVGNKRTNKYEGLPYYDEVIWLRKPKKYGV